jgi:hypothetical protein
LEISPKVRTVYSQTGGSDSLFYPSQPPIKNIGKGFWA